MAEADALLDTEYWIYEHGETKGRIAAGTDHDSVPEDLREHIDFVHPSVMLTEFKSKLSAHDDTTIKKKNTAVPRQTSDNSTCADL